MVSLTAVLLELHRGTIHIGGSRGVEFRRYEIRQVQFKHAPAPTNPDVPRIPEVVRERGLCLFLLKYLHLHIMVEGHVFLSLLSVVWQRNTFCKS